MPDEAPSERGLVCFPPAKCESTQIAASFSLPSPRNRLVEPKMEASGSTSTKIHVSAHTSMALATRM